MASRNALAALTMAARSASKGPRAIASQLLPYQCIYAPNPILWL